MDLATWRLLRIAVGVEDESMLACSPPQVSTEGLPVFGSLLLGSMTDA